MKAKYKIGQCVVAKEDGKFGEERTGQIKNIEESTGTRKGIIYKVDNHFFFEDEIKGVFPTITKIPSEYYTEINHIYDKIEYDIRSIVKTIGTKRVNRRAPDGHGRNTYTLSISNNKFGDCIVNDKNGNIIKLTKAIINNDDNWCNDGYLYFEDADGNKYMTENCIDIPRNQLCSIYSHIFVIHSNKILAKA